MEMRYKMKKIGIIGGGQLGKMMIQEANKLNVKTVILDPTADCPAHEIADEHIVASFYDRQAMRQLAESCDVCTYEFEHIDANFLLELCEEGYEIHPHPAILKTIQNKYRQKEFLKKYGIPMSQYEIVTNLTDIHKATRKFGFPLMLKACEGGYDGKGNEIIRNREDIEKAFLALGAGQVPLMVESFVHFTKELSVLVARGEEGTVQSYSVAENEHVNSILRRTIFPAHIEEKVSDEAKRISEKIVEVLGGRGLFCVELFLDEQGQLLLNEVAPRPHNSGHCTIEACVTSQFEQHIRCVSGLPLGSVKVVQQAVMHNVIGETEGIAMYEGVPELLRVEGAHLHIYGKEQVKKGRKMAHITVCGKTRDRLLDKAVKASECLYIQGGPV